MKSRPVVTAAKAGGDVTSVAGLQRQSIQSEKSAPRSVSELSIRGGKKTIFPSDFSFLKHGVTGNI